MKPKIKVLVGWKLLPKGVIIEKGDQFDLSGKSWEISESIGLKTGYFLTNGRPTRYIRRKPTTRK